MPSINVAGLQLDLPDYYSPGQRIVTTAEAAVLNSARRRALRDQLVSHINSGDVPPGEEQEVLVQLAARFKFDLPSAARSTDPLDRMAWKMASDLAAEELRKRGKSRGDLHEGKWEELVARIASSPSVKAEASRRLQASREIAEDVLALGDLG